MGYRMLPVFGVLALSMTLAGPAFAQAWPRTPNGGWNNGGYYDYAYDNGYRSGAHEGEEDARRGKSYNYKRDDDYEDADRGFRGGDKNAYRHEFRRGYEAGYDTAYRRFARGGWYDNRQAYPAYGGGYGYGYTRIAYDNGYRDGVEEGSKDFRRERAYEPFRRERFRDGDHGYERRYGNKDAYRAVYRNGFSAGYQVGYRGHRD